MSAGEKVKGSTHRLVQIPGYNLRPQYDLTHTRHLVVFRRSKRKSFSLNLAPMVDMFSILVIYLIMNFSSSGEVFFISKDIKIPQASKGQPMQSFPLISVVNNKVMFDAENKDGGESLFVEDINDGNLPILRKMLQQVRKVEKEIGGETNFRGQVNLQADENLPIEEVKKVMRVLIDEGWTGINFIIEPTGGS
ncbi:MAG: biopolymer transporter ExbD [Bdellovibrionales bacterium]|nr:biopolymer transporter ExbD [Bdellovibrionales bacterium]